MPTDKGKQSPATGKGGKPVSSVTIQSTPILRGKDLVDLVNDLQRPDMNKERRRRALELLEAVSKDKK